MLSKMGWSPGKGLGINEDGEKEHIKLSIKQDNLGIGATKKTTDNWLDNSSAFDELLKGLNDKFQTGEKEEREKLEMDEKDNGSKQDSDNKTKIRVKPQKNKKENNNQNKKSISNLQLSSSSSTFTLSNNNEPTANTSDSGSSSSIRLAHRAKFLKSKKAAIQNSDRLNEIFGIKSNKNSIDNYSSESLSTKSVLSSSSSEKDSKEKIGKVDIITKVNVMSTNEYFAQKMKGLKIASTSYNKTNDDVDERPSFKQDANISNTSSKGLRFISNNDNSKSNKKRKIDNDNVNDSGDSGDYKSIKSNKKSKKKEMRKEKKKNKS